MPGPSGGEVDARLLQLLEQLVANQSVQAYANLNDEVAERLEAAVRLRGTGTGTPQAAGFTDAQQQLVTRFRALRNGLGNLARHADQSTVRMPSPTLDAKGVLRFVDALPAEAAVLRVFDAAGREITRFDVYGGTTEVTGVPQDTAAVEVDDSGGGALLLGFPHRPQYAVRSKVSS
jgi:hypothetical protein